MKVLVTGGAGYVGSTVASALQDFSDQPVVIDDLSTGRPEFLRSAPSYRGDIADTELIDRVFTEHPDIEIVIHCAARTIVSESLRDPLSYYRENVAKTIRLFDQIRIHGCNRVIFGSSAAVYGASQTPMVDEASPVAPATPYAAGKLMIERILDDLCTANGMNALSLRYFNPVGADPQLRSGPYALHPTSALGNLINAARTGEPFRIHGADWATPDGTPIRDFVHVWDVACAHVAAAHRWTAITVGSRHEILNIGSGQPTTIRELAAAFNAHVGPAVKIEYDDRRPGDTVGCYTSIAKAQNVLNWVPQRSVLAALWDAMRWSEAWTPDADGQSAQRNRSG